MTDLHPITGLPGAPPTLGRRAVLQCTRRVWLEYDDCYPSRDKVPVPAAMELGGDDLSTRMDEVGRELRAALGARLVDAGWAGVWAERSDALGRTQKAMADGAEFVWRPALADDTAGGRRGEPHLLVRQLRRVDGAWAYLPVDVRGHRPLEGHSHEREWPVSVLADPRLGASVPTELGKGRPHGSDDLRLAHVVRMLEALGHADQALEEGEAWAGVIDPTGRLLWRNLAEPGAQSPSRLERYDDAFRERLRIAHAARWHEAGAPEAVELCSTFATCRRNSPWREQERRDHEAADSLVLLSGLRQHQADKLVAAGVGTRTALAGVTRADLPALGAATGLADLRDLTLTARAWARKEVLARAGFVGVERADVEIDIDMENDAIVYLWGLEVTSAGTPSLEGRASFWAADSSAEAEAGVVADFWLRLTSALAEAAGLGLSSRVYSYSAAEASTLRKLADRHVGGPGVPTREAVEELLGSEVWVDLEKVVQQLAWPVDGTSVKAIAPVIGFAWGDDDPSGGNSMFWRREFEQALASGDGTAPEHRRRIVAYNADDLRVMRRLREWVSEHGPHLPRD